MTQPIDNIFNQLRVSLTTSASEKSELDAKIEAIRSALRPVHFQFSKIHSTAPSKLVDLVNSEGREGELAKIDLDPLVQSVSALNTCDNGSIGSSTVMAFHKYAGLWAEPLQQAMAVVLLQYWIVNNDKQNNKDNFNNNNSNDLNDNESNMITDDNDEKREIDLLASPQYVAQFFNVPLSGLEITPESALADATKFHISIPNYLHAVLILCSELARLAFNSVTTAATVPPSHDKPSERFDLPVTINKFLKDVQAAYLSLNLKNDSLRRRTDGLKYDVKTVEQIVYDLTLRGLI